MPRGTSVMTTSGLHIVQYYLGRFPTRRIRQERILDAGTSRLSLKRKVSYLNNNVACSALKIGLPLLHEQEI